LSTTFTIFKFSFFTIIVVTVKPLRFVSSIASESSHAVHPVQTGTQSNFNRHNQNQPDINDYSCGGLIGNMAWGGPFSLWNKS